MAIPAFREEDIEFAFLAPELCEKTVEILCIRYVTLHAGHIAANLLNGSCEFSFPTTGDVNV